MFRHRSAASKAHCARPSLQKNLSSTSECSNMRPRAMEEGVVKPFAEDPDFRLVTHTL
jgi:hypothetical protein